MSNEKSPTGAPWRNLYGRRHGKSLRDSQKGYLADDLAALTVQNVSWAENPDRRQLDLVDVFERDAPVWLEIGFGGGEHMVHQATLNPGVGIIGCEPYINGVAMLLGKIRDAGVDNLRIHAGDARDMMDVLPKASVARVFLLYPDPWPKARHHRRRFVNPEFLDPLAGVMQSGAVLRVATDIKDYLRQTLEQMEAHPKFARIRCSVGDLHTPWEDWIATRYEIKAQRHGRVPHYMTFVRR